MTNGKHGFQVERVESAESAQSLDVEIAARAMGTQGGRHGRLKFYLTQIGSGDWFGSSFSAILFEDIHLDLVWNPVATLLNVRGRTRRFNHPIPSPDTVQTIQTRLVLLDAAGAQLAAPVQFILERAKSDSVADTGLMEFRTQQALDFENVDMNSISRMEFLGQLLDPIP